MSEMAESTRVAHRGGPTHLSCPAPPTCRPRPWPGPASSSPSTPTPLGPHPALPPGPGAGRLADPRGHGRHRRPGRGDPDRGARNRHLLRHVPHRAGGQLPGGRVHQHRLPAQRGGRAAGARRGDARGQRRRHHHRRDHHPRGGRVPGRLRPGPVRAGQPPLRRGPDPRELRPAWWTTCGPGPGGRHPRHGTLNRVRADRRAGGRPGPGGRRAGGHGRGPGQRAAEAEAAKAADAVGGGGAPGGHHRPAQDRHLPAGARRLPHPGALPGHRRLRRLAQGPGHDPRGRGRTRSTRPACWAGAVPGSRPGASGRCCARPRSPTWWSTGTRASRPPSRTTCSSSATPTS